MEKKNVKTIDKGLDKKKQVIKIAGASIVAITVGCVGYVRGYKRAQGIASGIVDCIAEEFDKPKDRERFYDIWNYGVNKYFDKLSKN